MKRASASRVLLGARGLLALALPERGDDGGRRRAGGGVGAVVSRVVLRLGLELELGLELGLVLQSLE